jgi:heterotetrameric sarcosine oxidase gamma subunit
VSSVAARAGAMPGLMEAAGRLGFELPAQPRFCDGGGWRAVWFGPERWLVFGAPDAERQLRAQLGTWATITDQSDARVLLRVAGWSARDVLAKGLPIDLHPRAFGPGDVALTLAGHVPLAVWQVDATPSFVLAIPRSYARSAADWLGSAAAAYRIGPDNHGPLYAQLDREISRSA